jgi:hypothetical protein
MTSQRNNKLEYLHSDRDIMDIAQKVKHKIVRKTTKSVTRNCQENCHLSEEIDL